MSQESYHFLVIEDAPFDYLVTKSILQRKFPNSDITFAISMKQARKVLNSKKKIDAILLDLSLPDAQGDSVINEIMSLSGDALVIVITGLEDKEYGLKTLKIGIADYIEKQELSPNILYKTITYGFERRAAARKLKEASEEISRSEEKFRALLTCASDTIITVCMDNKICFINQTDKVFNSKNLIGKYIIDFIPQEFVSNFKKVSNLVKSKKTTSNFEFFIRNKKNEETWYSVNVGPVLSGKKVTGYVLVSRDITERKKVENEIHILNKQLRNFSSHLEKAREDERMHISREIHDELGQLLTSIKFLVSFAVSRKDINSVEARDKLTNALELINSTIKAVRRVASDLRPGILDDLGLEAAIEWHLQDFSKKTGIQCKSKMKQLKCDYPSYINNSLFRIVQESLTNVARHSQATSVNILLEEKEQHLYLKLHDNGIGIDPISSGQSNTLGLIGMKERAAMHQGEFTISGNKKQGTTINVKIPIQL